MLPPAESGADALRHLGVKVEGFATQAGPRADDVLGRADFDGALAATSSLP